MYEDDPQDKVFDVLGEAVFGDHPLGRPIIGRAEVVAGTPAAELRAFHARALRAAQTWSSRPPARSTTTRSSSWSRRRGRRRRRPAPPPGAAGRRPTRRRAPALRRQGHRAVPRLPRRARHRPRRRAPLRAARARHILGGTSSSRLFQEVREQRGLAYSVYSFTGPYAGTGQIGLYLGTRPDNVGAALQVVGDRAGPAAGRAGSPPTSSTAPRRTSRAASCWRWSRRRRG